MAARQPRQAPQPVILPPATPSELLQHVIARTTYPTTVVIAWPRDQFLNALAQDVRQSARARRADGDADEAAQHPLLHASLAQTAVSRHINLVFAPTVAHLRAYLSTFSQSDIKTPPPPASTPLEVPPLLLVYGHVELHRHGTQWSAQGLGFSTAVLVDGAMRNSHRAAIVEPRRTGSTDELEQLLEQTLPILTGTVCKDDGSWAGPVVALGRLLSSWFEVDAKAQVA
ncbi:uncharacterized protein UV8b_04463 [Ustilaginoidea virens]|uniref:Uncharacterized protein n=1 Tax=Ustilaginoidea virens TaxID=1159556 RepID=A0A8E5MHR4_USTVR|nr:uncharacterized protein UV8b_04463 [Ustilaginoidea virens]QUC20222.1 hypothetical protein UV8b_04463 [Ustilaginoidea virens]